MTERVYNFNAGPAALPLPVLEQVQRELLDFGGTGMSILEMSHRSPVYDEIHHQAMADLRSLLDTTDEHVILFMGGGAQTQFALVPTNLLPAGGHADYLVTGAWSAAAWREATTLGEARTLWSSAATGYDRVPGLEDYVVDSTAAYLHYTSNNTIMGTQFSDVPEAGAVPLVSDMSSDLLSRPIPLSRFGLIYAGAQKNMGPAGVTVVLIRRDVLERCRPDLPTMWSYIQIAAKHSLQNTPPVFAIYIVGLMARHLLAQGGLAVMAAYNATKAALLYSAIDASGGFYRGHAQPQSRSHMNVTFHLPTPELDARFVTHSMTADLHGLQGHTGLGGIRAALYNAVPLEAVHALVAFMHDFQQRYG
jgi:phosphoserine aminotransferase